MKIFITLVTNNSLKYLPLSLEAIFDQSAHNFEVIIVDNASMDGTADFVRQNYPEATVLRNYNDRGAAHAKNQAAKIIRNKIAAEGGNFDDICALFIDSSIILPKDFIKCLDAALKNNDDGGSFAFKVLRLGSKDFDEPISDFNSAIVDSAGISVNGAGRMRRIGQGERDVGQFEVSKEVFGPDQVIALYRLSALEDSAFDDQYFDADFFEAEEDLDLVWRLRLLGWKSYFLSTPHVFRFGGSPDSDKKIWPRIKNYHHKIYNYRFLRNHFWVLVKNQQFINLIIFSPQFFMRETAKFLHSLLFRQKNLKAYYSVFLGVPKMIKKRFLIYKKNHLASAEMRRIFKLK